jgi:AAA domain
MIPDSPRLRALDLIDPSFVGWENVFSAVRRGVPPEELSAAAAILIETARHEPDGPSDQEIRDALNSTEEPKKTSLSRVLQVQARKFQEHIDEMSATSNDEIEKLIMSRTVDRLHDATGRMIIELAEADPRIRARQGRFLTWEGLMAQEPPTWLVPGLIPVGSVGSILGASQSLKTFFLIHLALSLCAGKAPFGEGEDALTPTQFVMIVGEGASGIMGRMKAWAERYNVIQPLPVRVLTAPENFGDDAKIDALIAEIGELRIPGFRMLIGVDTLSANFSGDENGSDVTNFVRNCLRVSKELCGEVERPDSRVVSEDATVVFVHHLGKDKSKGARGHSSLHANVDFEITLERKDSKSGNIQTRVKCTKQKDGSTDLDRLLGADVAWVDIGKDDMPRDVLVMRDQFEAGQSTSSSSKSAKSQDAWELAEIHDCIEDCITRGPMRVSEIVKSVVELGSERSPRTLSRWVEQCVNKDPGVELGKDKKDNANIIVSV